MDKKKEEYLKMRGKKNVNSPTQLAESCCRKRKLRKLKRGGAAYRRKHPLKEKRKKTGIRQAQIGNTQSKKNGLLQNFLIQKERFL